jgi:hypothetical protein
LAVWSFLVFFVFVAPLLHLYWNVWLRYVPLPADIRPWMGVLALWTLVGLLAMVAARRLAVSAVGAGPARREIQRRRFLLLGASLIGLAVSAQIRVHLVFGGFAGLFSAFENGLESFQGMGPWIVVAETMPTLAAALVLALVRRRRLAGLGAPLLLLFTALQLAVSWPYGSRAHIVVPLLWSFVAWDRMVAPLRRRHALLLGAVVASLLFVYGLYKSFGSFATALPAQPSATVERAGSSLEEFVLLDLGRYDVQALLLERWSKPDHWRPGRGRTYLGGLLSLAPSRLYPGKPDSKVREGTDALLGAGFFAGHSYRVSNQFGLAGEAVLNFGPWAIPAAYALFGFLVAVASRIEAALPRRDPRWLLLAFAPPLAVRMLMTDSDNVALVVFESLLFLGPLVWLATRRAPLRRVP